MKKRFLVCFLTVLLFCAGVVIAGERATKEECVSKCKEVAKLIQEKGINAAVEAIMASGSPYMWKDSYVFMIDMNGLTLAHPASPKLVGQNVTNFKDANGKLFVAEYMAVAKEKGEGWVDYMWLVPGTKEVKPKQTYVYKVPGKDAIVLAGIYNYE